MKAITFSKYGTPAVLQLKEIDKPIPKDNEVLVKIKAASVNDWDWGLVQGKPLVIRLLIGLFRPKKINIPGVDIAGVVESVGKNITEFKIGDEVFGDLSEYHFGGFAEYVCADEKSLVIKPKKMSFVDAASLPHASMLAVQGLIEYGQIKKGQKVLINGAGGGVGTIGIQIAKQYNVQEITGVDSEAKLELLQNMGFDHVIDYKKQDFTKTENKYDLILDVKTNRSIFSYARSLNKNGIYVTVGGFMNRIIQAAMLRPFIWLFSKKKILVLSLKPNKDLDYIINLYNEGKIKTVIDGPYQLEEIPEILQYFGEGKHKGKIIITL